jgi:leucyl/phenylalanyl-tRNA--protein transferase
MAVYALTEDLAFPDPALAEPDGLLAVGGDLSPERLLLAYANGIFPWYNNESPILWWSPDPRMVLYPGQFKLHKSLRQKIQSRALRITADTAFPQVIAACASIPRKEDTGTWILPEMQDAYIQLHTLGFAHSVEVWEQDKLCGGLYGVSLGRAFFGESMFFHCPDASKIALYQLCQFCLATGIQLIDAQMHTPHLERLGAILLPGHRFRAELAKAMETESLRGAWTKHPLFTPSL